MQGAEVHCVQDAVPDEFADLIAAHAEHLLNGAPTQQKRFEIIKLGNSVGESHAVYEFKATAPRIPASNLKLVTTATARTPLVFCGQPMRLPANARGASGNMTASAAWCSANCDRAGSRSCERTPSSEQLTGRDNCDMRELVAELRASNLPCD